MFYILIIIYFAKESLFLKICYIQQGFPQQYVSIEYNPELSFYPKFLKLNVKSTEYNYKRKLGILTDENYYLKISNTSCLSPFIYEVPQTTMPIIKLNMDIIWGEDFPILLDEIPIVIKSDFEERYIEVSGLNNHIQMGILLKHQPEFEDRIKAEYNPQLHFEMSEKAEKLQPGEHYCLRFFTLNFKKPLEIFKLIPETVQPMEFYRFDAFIFFNKNHPPYPIKSEYLVNVFRCQPSKSVDDRLTIYVYPVIEALKIRLSEETSGYEHTLYLENIQGQLIPNSHMSNLDFNELRVKPQQLTQDMVDNKEGLFLYEKKSTEIRCRVRIPEILDHLWFSYIEKIYIATCIADRRIHVVDMSTQEYKIFRIRIGSKSEIVQCEEERKLK